jgi:hypothetical protein
MPASFGQVVPLAADAPPGVHPRLIPLSTLHGYIKSGPARKSLSAKERKAAVTARKAASSTRRLAAAEADAAEALLQGGVYNAPQPQLASSRGDEDDDEDYDDAMGFAGDGADDGDFYRANSGTGRVQRFGAAVGEEGDFSGVLPRNVIGSAHASFPNLQQLYGSEGVSGGGFSSFDD